MSNYSSLKATINANVKTNGNQEITGQVMNAVLNAMVNSLGSGYQYMGIATPTNPGTNQTPDDRCFYIATTPGTYSHLGGLVVNDGEVAILKYDSAWSKEVTGAATAEQLTQLDQKIDEYAEGKFYGVFASSTNLPAGTIPGFAYVGTESPFAVWSFDGEEWEDSGATMDSVPAPSVSPFKGLFQSSAALNTAYPTPADGDYAYVNIGGTPAVIHIFTATSGSWSDSGFAVSPDIESVFTTQAKLALLIALEKVAWIDGNGQSYIDTLRNALLGVIEIESVTAVFDPGDDWILDTMELDKLRDYLTVTVTYSDGMQEVVSNYELRGSMTAGTQTMVVDYLGETGTFSVEVLHNLAAALSSSAYTFHPGNNRGTASYSDGVIVVKCGNSTDVSNYNVWTIDNKKTLWSSVVGKTLKWRVKVNDINLTATGLGVYQSNNISSLGASYSRRSGGINTMGELKENGYYEGTFICQLTNFSTGSLNPGANATFGVFAYARSASEYGQIIDVQIIDITE